CHKQTISLFYTTQASIKESPLKSFISLKRSLPHKASNAFLIAYRCKFLALKYKLVKKCNKLYNIFYFYEKQII
ncbi:hypothetical protein DRG08_07780, partial [Campylobacter upsaliensis]|nr:hypothetical protein [Campylobacter upsaliensis]